MVNLAAKFIDRSIRHGLYSHMLSENYTCTSLCTSNNSYLLVNYII